MLVIQWKCKIVICSLVRFVKIALVMPNFAQDGLHIAPIVLLSRDAVENHAICAESVRTLNMTKRMRMTTPFNSERISNNKQQN